MTDKNITILSFDDLPDNDESAWESFDAMTDEEAEAVDDPENPHLTTDQLNQFKRTYYVKGEKVWEDEKTVGEWLAEQGKIPEMLPVDPDVVAWFKAQGQDYQLLINTVLKDYVEAHQ